MKAVEHLFTRYETFRTMRASRPVFLDDHGRWHVFRHADVECVISDSRSFSSRVPFGGNLLGETMIRRDPPDHRRLRRLTSQAFSARRIALYEPRIREIAAGLLADADTEVDVIGDLAAPLPVVVMAELLGVEPERRAEFKHWSEIFMSLDTPRPDGAAPPAMAAMKEYFVEAIEDRRRTPRDDLVGALVRAATEDGRLSESELLGFCFLLLLAGNETTANLIGNATICLASHPEALQRIRREPTLIAAAVEETMRYLAPVQVTVRISTEPVSLSGVRIPAGARVMAWNGSANRDESVFDEPDRFRLDRDNLAQTTFGRGIHFCLGASVARIEARAALEALLARVPGPWRIPGGPLQAVGPFFLCGVTSLPLTSGAPAFEAGSRPTPSPRR